MVGRGLNKGLPSRGLVLSVPAPLNAYISPPRCCETQYRPGDQNALAALIYNAEQEIEGEEREKPSKEAPIREIPGIKFASRKESTCRTLPFEAIYNAVLELHISSKTFRISEEKTNPRLNLNCK